MKKKKNTCWERKSGQSMILFKKLVMVLQELVKADVRFFHVETLDLSNVLILMLKTKETNLNMNWGSI